jgi:flagellar biosynthesis protein FlhA
VKKLVKDLPKDTKKLLDDVVPAHISWSGVQRVLQALLRERVSIRDLAPSSKASPKPRRTCTTWSDHRARARPPRAPALLPATAARTARCRSSRCRPNWEQAFAESLVGQGEQRSWRWRRRKLQDFVARRPQAFEKSAQQGETPGAAHLPGKIRPFVRSTDRTLPRPSTAVMSQSEVHAKVRLKAMGPSVINMDRRRLAGMHRHWPARRLRSIFQTKTSQTLAPTHANALKLRARLPKSAAPLRPQQLLRRIPMP